MKVDSIRITEVEELVKSYIVTSLTARKHGETLRESDDLLMILDSLQVLRLVIYLETTFAFKVPDDEITPENLGSVETVAALVLRKLV